MAVPTTYGIIQSTPQQDLEKSDRLLRWGTWIFIIAGFVNAVEVAVFAPVGGHWLRTQFDKCIDQLNAGATSCNEGSSAHVNIVLYALGAPGVLAQVAVALWLFQIATIGRRLGLPARREPGWAFAFFVPVVALWFPYQVAADALPPTHPRRSVVGWWWAFFLTQGLAFVPALIVGAVASEGAAVVVGLVGCVVPILVGVFGVRMVREIHAAHRGLLRVQAGYPS